MEAIGRLTRLGVGLLAIAASVGLFAAVWPRRGRTTARWLLGVAATLATGSALYLLVGPVAPRPLEGLLAVGTNDGLWIVLGAVATVVAGGNWSLFAFRYVGRSGTPLRGLAACVGVLSAGAVLCGAGFARGGAVAFVDLLSLLLLATAVVVGGGVVSLLWVSLRSNAYPFAEPLALSGGAVVLLAGIHVAQVFDSPSIYPATIALSAGLFLVPVVRYPVFDTLPAARVAGRDRVVDEMAAGVIIVDRDGNVRDANPRAESLFGVRLADTRGRPLDDVLPTAASAAAVVDAPEPRLVETDDGTVLELTGDRITGQRGRQFGFLLRCEDVTDRRIREEQLALLRRFVVDVVGTQMASVRADAAGLSNDGTGSSNDETGQSNEPTDASDATERADRIWERTTTLTELVAHARSVERAIGQEDDRPHDVIDLRQTLRTVADEVVADAATGSTGDDSTRHDAPTDASSADPTLTVELPDQPLPTDVPRALLHPVLRSLLDAAYQSDATEIELAALDDGRPTIRLRDDRAANADDRGGTTGESTGEADGEVDPGPSTSVARLAIEQLGGSVAVTDATDDRCVTIRLPSVETADESGGESKCDDRVDVDETAGEARGGPS